MRYFHRILLSLLTVGLSLALSSCNSSPVASNPGNPSDPSNPTSASASSHEYLYISTGVSAGTPEFYAYAIDAATGNLTPVPGMPFQASVGATPSPCGGGCSLSPLADPMGRFLFYNFTQTPNQHGVGTMSVDSATGALTNNSVLTFTPVDTSVPGIDYISVDAQGRFIFGTGVLSSPGPYGSDWLSAIAIGSSGSLSFVSGQPFELPEGNNSSPPLAPAVTDQFVFVSDPAFYDSSGNDQPSDMFTFSMNQSSGALTTPKTTQLGPGAGAQGAGPQVITPSGNFLYVETHSTQSTGFPGPAELAGYQVNSDGSLTAISQAPLATPQQPAVITMSPNGNFLFVSGVIYPPTPGGPVSNDISAYAIDQETGALSLTANYTNNADGILIYIDPAAKYAYVGGTTISDSGTAENTLVGFSVDPTTGALTQLPSAPLANVVNGEIAIVSAK